MKDALRNIAVFTFVLFVVAALLLITEKRDEELMKIKYCWSSEGEHYVYPDARCTYGGK